MKIDRKLFTNKRMMQAGAVALSAVLLTAGAASFAVVGAAEEGDELAAMSGHTAGVVGEIGNIESEAFGKAASVGASDVTVVAAGVPTSVLEDVKAAEDADAAEDAIWEDRVMADVEVEMNVRSSADASAEVVGYLRKGNVAEATGHQDGWTKIVSGGVEGFVKDDYLVSGEDAEDLAENLGIDKDNLTFAMTSEERAAIEAEAARKAAEEKAAKEAEAKKLVAANSNSSAAADKKAAEKAAGKSQAAAQNAQQPAAAPTDAEKAAAAQAEAEKAAAQAAAQIQQPATEASIDDQTLLAALIMCEAGNQPYEGQLAVGAVVMNRVRSSRYPNTISGVIYQKSQFGPARNGSLKKRLANGQVSDSCKQAAAEALSGVDNVEGRLSFNNVKCGHDGLVIGQHVFW